MTVVNTQNIVCVVCAALCVCGVQIMLCVRARVNRA